MAAVKSKQTLHRRNNEFLHKSITLWQVGELYWCDEQTWPFLHVLQLHGGGEAATTRSAVGRMFTQSSLEDHLLWKRTEIGSGGGLTHLTPDFRFPCYTTFVTICFKFLTAKHAHHFAHSCCRFRKQRNLCYRQMRASSHKNHNPTVVVSTPSALVIAKRLVSRDNNIWRSTTVTTCVILLPWAIMIYSLISIWSNIFK